jgi:hypothetical protein
MATIYRALLTAVLALFGWVAWTGWKLGLAEPAARDSAIALHVRTGLVVALVAAAAQSVPFAYFLGTGFWVKAFVRASRAGPEWERRHKLWMKGRAYPAMYLGPMLTLATAVTGGLVHTGRVAPVWHGCSAVLAIVACAFGLLLVPPVMLRNSALMDELADRHQVPKPDTPAAAALIEHESKQALPPLFQLSRVLMFAGVQCMVVWLYLRFGTDGWRGTRVMPFAASFVLLLTVGLGLNAMHDPQRPRPPGQAWGRALLIGTACAVALTLLL